MNVVDDSLDPFDTPKAVASFQRRMKHELRTEIRFPETNNQPLPLMNFPRVQQENVYSAPVNAPLVQDEATGKWSVGDKVLNNGVVTAEQMAAFVSSPLLQIWQHNNNYGNSSGRFDAVSKIN